MQGLPGLAITYAGHVLCGPEYNVLFSDAPRFNLSTADGRVRVFRWKGERFAQNFLLEHDRFGGGSVMVWGGIRVVAKRILIVIINGNLKAQGYVDIVLRPVAVPFLEQHPGCLMHGNARPQTAIFTQPFLARHDVNVLLCPACFPDMDPIEHLWDLLGRNAKKKSCHQQHQ